MRPKRVGASSDPVAHRREEGPMRKKNTAPLETPSIDQLERQLRQERYKIRYQYALRTTVYTLLAVAAAAILIATLWLPVLQIYGSSMNPTLTEGQLVVAVKGDRLEHGDIVAFYYNNKILVKRVIAGPGQWVDIDEEGTVFLDGEELEEPYLTERAYGQCDIELPYQVPDGHYFVLGDHRSTSVDSRSTSVGCVSKEQIVGRLYLRIWPLRELQMIR